MLSFPSHPSFVIAKPRASSPSVKLGLSSATMLEKPFIVMPKPPNHDLRLSEGQFLFCFGAAKVRGKAVTLTQPKSIIYLHGS